MIRAALKTYLSWRGFWALNLIGLGLLVLYSLVLVGMDRVGWMPVSGLDYLVGSLNVYLTNLLPLLVCLFAAQAFASEYQWRTLMIPLFEGVPRWRIALSKVVLSAVATVVFVAVYLVAAAGLAFLLFSFKGVMLESRVISAGEALFRLAVAGGWLTLVICLFGWLALALVVQLRQPLLAGIGAFLVFIAILETQGPRSPFAPWFQVAQTLVKAPDLANSDVARLVARGGAIWLAAAALIIGWLLCLFNRRDITLDA